MTALFVTIGFVAVLLLLKKLFQQPLAKPRANSAKDAASSIPPSVPLATKSDRFTQTVHKGDVLEIPISIKSPFMAEPMNVGSLSMQTSLVFERDEVLSDLKRQATAEKDVKDWPKAIALAHQIKVREGDAYKDTRLAMYLQQAGLFDEAMAEFDWLLSMVPPQCDAIEASMTPNRRRFCIAHASALIHDKIRIAAKREKRFDLVTKHQELHSQYQEEADRLRPVIDREWTKERRAYEAKEARLEKKRQSSGKR